MIRTIHWKLICFIWSYFASISIQQRDMTSTHIYPKCGLTSIRYSFFLSVTSVWLSLSKCFCLLNIQREQNYHYLVFSPLLISYANDNYIQCCLPISESHFVEKCLLIDKQNLHYNPTWGLKITFEQLQISEHYCM